MSQLIDGELSSSDADRLNSYLEQHPEEIDWMESLDALRDPQELSRSTSVPIASIQQAIDEEESSSSAKNLITFPAFFKPLAAAAAIAIVGSVTWLGLRPTTSSAPHPEPALVEFVTTDIPDASTFVYSDEESGWTVVWVETDASLPEDHG